MGPKQRRPPTRSHLVTPETRYSHDGGREDDPDVFPVEMAVALEEASRDQPARRHYTMLQMRESAEAIPRTAGSDRCSAALPACVLGQGAMYVTGNSGPCV